MVAPRVDSDRSGKTNDTTAARNRNGNGEKDDCCGVLIDSVFVLTFDAHCVSFEVSLEGRFRSHVTLEVSKNAQILDSTTSSYLASPSLMMHEAVLAPRTSNRSRPAFPVSSSFSQPVKESFSPVSFIIPIH